MRQHVLASYWYANGKLAYHLLAGLLVLAHSNLAKCARAKLVKHNVTIDTPLAGFLIGSHNLACT